MATKLPTSIIADFTTQLSTKVAVGDTTATLQSITDDDGVTIPNGTYLLTIDAGNTSKEHIVCTNTGTSLASISSVSRQGAQTSGFARAHRVGATVTMTDFGSLRYLNDLVRGTTTLNSAIPLGYDGSVTPTGNQLSTKNYNDSYYVALTGDQTIAGVKTFSSLPTIPATPSASTDAASKGYVDGVAIAGASNASTTAKGIVELATASEINAGTATGGTGAALVVTPDQLLSSNYKEVLALTLMPSPTYVPFMAYTGDNGSSQVVIGMASNTTMLVAQYNFDKAITVNKITVQTRTVSTTGSINFCVYSEDGSTQLLATTITISASDTVTTKTLSSPVTFTKGNYYVGVQTISTTNANFIAYGNYILGIGGAGNSILSNVTSEPKLCGYITGLTAGTAPSTITPTSLAPSSTDSYGIMFRLDN